MNFFLSLLSLPRAKQFDSYNSVRFCWFYFSFGSFLRKTLLWLFRIKIFLLLRAEKEAKMTQKILWSGNVLLRILFHRKSFYLNNIFEYISSWHQRHQRIAKIDGRLKGEMVRSNRSWRWRKKFIQNLENMSKLNKFWFKKNGTQF